MPPNRASGDIELGKVGKKEFEDTDWRYKFLRIMSVTPTPGLAAKACGVSKVSVYKHRKNYKKFRKAWVNAVKEACERAERQVFKRALDPEDPASEKFIKMILNRFKPKTWGDKKKEDNPGVTVNVAFQALQDLLPPEYLVAVMQRINELTAVEAPAREMKQLPGPT